MGLFFHHAWHWEWEGVSPEAWRMAGFLLLGAVAAILMVREFLLLVIFMLGFLALVSTLVIGRAPFLWAMTLSAPWALFLSMVVTAAGLIVLRELSFLSANLSAWVGGVFGRSGLHLIGRAVSVGFFIAGCFWIQSFGSKPNPDIGPVWLFILTVGAFFYSIFLMRTDRAGVRPAQNYLGPHFFSYTIFGSGEKLWQIIQAPVLARKRKAEAWARRQAEEKRLREEREAEIREMQRLMELRQQAEERRRAEEFKKAEEERQRREREEAARRERERQEEEARRLEQEQLARYLAEGKIREHCQESLRITCAHCGSISSSEDWRLEQMSCPDCGESEPMAEAECATCGKPCSTQWGARECHSRAIYQATKRLMVFKK